MGGESEGIMDREQDKRLEELKASGKTIYSISRLDTINRCLYEAYQTYILGERGENNVYAMLGGKVHDVLEAIVNGEATEEDLQPAVDAELEDIDLLGLSFPKGRDGEDTIRIGWEMDMRHFCSTYKSPVNNGDLHTEELFIYTTPKGNILQGYIDLYKENKDGSISIYDYKTSSLYKGEDLKEHGRQLVLYALGKEQEGFKVRSVSWIFLKYVEIRFMGKKKANAKEKTEISKIVERKKIAQEMCKYIEQDLYELGIDDIDADIILTDFKRANSFDVLPEEIKNRYKMLPAVVEYDLTDEIKNEVDEYIDKTIEMWESLSEYPPRKFTKIQKNGKEVESTFFCNALCPHGKQCSYLKEYFDTRNKNEEEDDMFG